MHRIAALIGALAVAGLAYGQEEPEPSPTPAAGFGYERLEVGPGELDRDRTDFRLVPRIRYGLPEEWPAVARLVRFSVGGQSHYTSCSGTLLTTGVFLTAEHCMDDPGFGLFVLNGLIIVQTHSGGVARLHVVDGPVYRHPTEDAGLMFFHPAATEAVPGVLYSGPPGSYRVPESLWLTQGYGLYARTYGYGLDQYDLQPTTIPYAVTLPLVSTSEFSYAQAVTFGYPGGGGEWYGFPENTHVVDWTRLGDGAGYGSGDSGGPTITWDGDSNRDEEELIGVNKAVLPYPETLAATSLGLGTRVDRIEDWIVSTINGRNGRGCPGAPVQGCARPTSASISTTPFRASFRWIAPTMPAVSMSQGWMACVYSNGALVKTIAPPPELRCMHGRPCWRPSSSLTNPGATWRNNGGMHGVRQFLFRYSATRAVVKLTLNIGVTIPGPNAHVQFHVAGGCLAAAFPRNEETTNPSQLFRSTHPTL